MEQSVKTGPGAKKRTTKKNDKLRDVPIRKTIKAYLGKTKKVNVSQDVVGILNALLRSLCERLVEASASTCLRLNKVLVTDRVVKLAIRDVLPEHMAENALRMANRAIAKMPEDGAKRTKKKKKVVVAGKKKKKVVVKREEDTVV